MEKLSKTVKKITLMTMTLPYLQWNWCVYVKNKHNVNFISNRSGIKINWLKLLERKKMKKEYFCFKIKMSGLRPRMIEETFLIFLGDSWCVLGSPGSLAIKILQILISSSHPIVVDTIFQHTDYRAVDPITQSGWHELQFYFWSAKIYSQKKF